ncbi:MAG: dihydrofolate reductase, partial [Muribaculaceae bacterium]|nr:dihydrofolate reductase [Muribaculaceae bacterium]
MKLHKTLALASALATATTAMANTLDPNNPSGIVVDRFADIEVLRYVVPGFQDLTLNQKKLIYFLPEAALQGRDILWAQNGKYNLPLRQ